MTFLTVRHAGSAHIFRGRVGAASREKKILAFLAQHNSPSCVFFYTRKMTLHAHDSGEGYLIVGEDELRLDDLNELAGCRFDLLDLSSCRVVASST